MSLTFKNSLMSCVVFVILFSSPSLKAQNPLSANLSQTDLAQAGVLIPWSFVQKWINERDVGTQTLIDERIERIDFNVSDIPVHIPWAQIVAHGSFAPVQVSSNMTRWQTNQLSLDLHLAGFEIQKEFVKEIDGATVIVTLKARCGDFAIRQNQAQFMTGLAWQAIDQGFQLSAEELNLAWPVNSWSVDSLICQGPEGFGEMVQRQISEALRDPQQIEIILKPLVQSRLNNYLAKSLEPLKKPMFLENNKIFSVQIGRTQVAPDQGLIIQMDIVTSPEYQEASPAHVANLVLPPGAWSQADQGPLLILPKKFFQDMARHGKIFPRLENKLNEIPAFRKILGSRFLQFFFWPELRKFKKDAPFQATSLVQGQDYAAPANSPIVRFIGGQRLAVSAGISTWVRAERDGQEINFGYFETSLKSEMSYHLQNGEMIFKLENPDLNIKASYAAEYLAKYKPKTKFPLSRLEKGMRAQLQLRNFKLALPVMDLESLGMKDQLRAGSVSEQGENLVFSFQSPSSAQP
jgi:hypothetical protein